MISDREHWEAERLEADAAPRWFVRPAIDEARKLLEQYDHDAPIRERTAIVGQARSILVRCLDVLGDERRELARLELERRDASR